MLRTGRGGRQELDGETSGAFPVSVAALGPAIWAVTYMNENAAAAWTQLEMVRGASRYIL